MYCLIISTWGNNNGREESMAVSTVINPICRSHTNLSSNNHINHLTVASSIELIKTQSKHKLDTTTTTTLNSNHLGRSFFNLKKSASNLFINELILTNNLISTDTNFYNNQNLRINKVGSYVELRLKRLSTSKCLLNNDDNMDLSLKNQKSQRLACYNSRRHSTASTDSFSSMYKSRSRSSSMSSLTGSYYSPSSQDSSFRLKTRPKPARKLRLKLCKKLPLVNLKASSQTTTQNISALMTKKPKKQSSQSSKTKFLPNSRPTSQKLVKPSRKHTKPQKNSKFSKFSNEDYYLSKNYFSQSSGMTHSLSQFNSLSDVNMNKGYSGGVGVNTNRKLKCLFVGDAQVGKSALMFLYLKRVFQHEYRPTIVDDYEVKIVLNGESYTLSLFDTAGQEDWETLRVMAYPDTDVILLCYSVVRPDSMENIKTKWMPELNKYLPDALIVLVGTQVDLRESALTTTSTDPRSRHISTREGEDLKQKIGAFRYIECSALTQLNIKEVFDSCIEAYAKSNPPIQPSCFETLFKRFTKTIRSRLNIRLHSSSNSSSANSNKLTKYSNKETKYLHE